MMAVERASVDRNGSGAGQVAGSGCIIRRTNRSSQGCCCRRQKGKEECLGKGCPCNNTRKGEKPGRSGGVSYNVERELSAMPVMTVVRA